MNTKSNKLQGKDLINIGIFAAIYMVITFAIAMLGYIPIFMPLLAVLVPLAGGIPFMLFLTKVKKFGMIWIMALLMGIFMLITGMGSYAIFTSAVFGLLADLVARSSNYKSTTKSVIATSLFSAWVWGNFLPMFVNQNYFTNLALNGYGQDYADKLQSYCPLWMCPTLLVAALVSGFIGGLIGKALLKKHFVKAGIV